MKKQISNTPSFFNELLERTGIGREGFKGLVGHSSYEETCRITEGLTRHGF